jgi:hypothetical protein
MRSPWVHERLNKNAEKKACATLQKILHYFHAFDQDRATTAYAHGSRLTAHGSRLTAHGSRLYLIKKRFVKYLTPQFPLFYQFSPGRSRVNARSLDFTSKSLDITPKTLDLSTQSLDCKPASVINTRFGGTNAPFSIHEDRGMQEKGGAMA